MNTNLLSKLAAAALLLLVASPAKADHTNLVRNLNIQLQGLRQGATTTSANGNSTTTADTVSVGNRRIIKALGDATGNTFSTVSKLVVVTPLHYPGGTKVQVRDGTNSAVDVTPFFSRYPLSDSVFSSQSTARTGRSSSDEYNIQEFDLVDDEDYAPLSLHYYVSGVGDLSTSSSPTGSTAELNATVSGSGDLDGELLILQGTISLRGQTYEIAADGPAPGV